MSVQARIEELLSNDNISVQSNAVQAALAKQREQQAEKMGTAILRVLDSADKGIKQMVGTLKAVRRQEKQIKQQLNEISRAIEYFKATGDPLPLHKYFNVHPILQVLGETQLPNDPKVYEVPADWQPQKDG